VYSPVYGSRTSGRRASGAGVAGIARRASNRSRHPAARPRWWRVPYIASASLPHHLHSTRCHTANILHYKQPEVNWNTAQLLGITHTFIQ